MQKAASLIYQIFVCAEVPFSIDISLRDLPVKQLLSKFFPQAADPSFWISTKQLTFWKC